MGGAILIGGLVDAALDAAGIDLPEEAAAALKQAINLAGQAAQNRSGPEAAKAVVHHATKADEKGKAEPATAIQSCPLKSGQKGPDNEPPEQKKLQNKIKKFRDELKRRYAEMRKDQHDLYNTARTESEAKSDKGSWDGHVLQFEQKQKALRKLLNEAKTKGYAIPDDAWRWATEASPVQPAPPQMNP